MLTRYALAFDLVVDELRSHYSAITPHNAYGEVRALLEAQGFAWQQGSVYFGDARVVGAVVCVLAAQRPATELPWFTSCVPDIRMLSIEENDDLGVALAGPASGR